MRKQITYISSLGSAGENSILHLFIFFQRSERYDFGRFELREGVVENIRKSDFRVFHGRFSYGSREK